MNVDYNRRSSVKKGAKGRRIENISILTTFEN